jgi:hypothetical protein
MVNGRDADRRCRSNQPLLSTGGADAIFDLLRPQFDDAAGALTSALSKVGIPHDPTAFLEGASPDELLAWQSVKPAVAVLDRVGAAVRMLGPNGAFPVVPDPRNTDPVIQCGWLHDLAGLCADGDLMAACVQFQKPSGDIRSSAWLRISPRLHTVSSARERLRAWCEKAWDSEESQHPRGGRLVDGTIIDDPKRPNPFALPKAS